MTSARVGEAGWFLGPAPGPTALTIGQFDGVHRGHQRLLAETRERADALGVAAGAVTFARHPLHLLAPHRAPAMLSRLDDKIRLLREHGMDFVLTLPVTTEVLRIPAERFAAELLGEWLNAKAVVVGADFRYGAGAAGDPGKLIAQLSRRGTDVAVMNTVLDDGERISSTRIRCELAAGRTDRAQALLGRRHRVRVTAGNDNTLIASPGTAWPGRGRYQVSVSAPGRAPASATALVRSAGAFIPGLHLRSGDRLTLTF